jgi:hypothetical protein
VNVLVPPETPDNRSVNVATLNTSDWTYTVIFLVSGIATDSVSTEP